MLQKYDLQISETPSTYPSNRTTVTPFFTSNRVQVLREEEAHPFDSFIADIGGVLGLFIGFNFLMIWDLLFLLYVKFKEVSQKTD